METIASLTLKFQELQAHDRIHQHVLAAVLVNLPAAGLNLRRVALGIEQTMLSEPWTELQIEQARRLLSLYLEAAPEEPPPAA